MKNEQEKTALTVMELVGGAGLLGATAGGAAGYRKGGAEGGARGAAGAGVGTPLGAALGGLGGSFADHALGTHGLGALGVLAGGAAGGVGGYKALTHGVEKKSFDFAALTAMREEYQKIADGTFTTSQYAGPMGTVPFQQASQLPGFKTPGLRAAIEKPQQKIAEDSGLATYGKHIALNAGQALRDIKGTFSHPIAEHVAPEGGVKRLLSSMALSTPNIAGDVFYGAVPPQLTHTKEELKGLGEASAGTWFRRGAGLEKEKGAAVLRSGKLPSVFQKEQGVLGRAKQLLSGERSLALKTYRERYENQARHLARKAEAHAQRSSPTEYVGALRRDAEITGRAAGRIGKIHNAEAAKSTAARGGVAATAAGGGFAAGRASGGEEKEASALTPAGRLVATQRKGTGMGASVTGPSIAEVAKPPRIGHPMPGALKNRI